MRLISVLIAAAGLVGCATPKIPTSNVGVAPGMAANATIVFYRPSGFYSGGMRPDILLDGRLVGYSAPGTKFKVGAAPGTYMILVKNSGAAAGGESLSVDVKAGTTVYVRTSMGPRAMLGIADVELVTAEVAEQESSRLEALN